MKLSPNMRRMLENLVVGRPAFFEFNWKQRPEMTLLSLRSKGLVDHEIQPTTAGFEAYRTIVRSYKPREATP